MTTIRSRQRHLPRRFGGLLVQLCLPFAVATAIAATATAAEPERPSQQAPLLMLPISGPEASAQAFEGELARALRRQLGATAVVTVQEIDVTLTAERTKDLIGCNDVACFAEILGALGGRFALAVTLVPEEPLAQVVVILRDLSDATRTFRLERRTPSLMPARLTDLADDIATGLLQTAGWRASAPLQAPLAAGGGRLDIQTSPSGARLFLNSEDIGHSPARLSGLAAGRYRVHTAAIGYATRSEVVDLSAGQQQRVDFDLDPLRDWTAGLVMPAGFREMRLRDSRGQSTTGSLNSVGVGAWYQREILGPLELGGLVAYHNLTYYADDPTGSDDIAIHHGVALGLHLSVGASLRFSNLGPLAAAITYTGPGRESAEQALEQMEERNVDWGLASIRARARLAFRTPGLVSLQLGVEFGIMSLMHVEIAWAPLLLAPELPYPIGGYTIDEIDTGGMAFHVVIGPSVFHPPPSLRP